MEALQSSYGFTSAIRTICDAPAQIIHRSVQLMQGSMVKIKMGTSAS